MPSLIDSLYQFRWKTVSHLNFETKQRGARRRDQASFQSIIVTNCLSSVHHGRWVHDAIAIYGCNQCQWITEKTQNLHWTKKSEQISIYSPSLTYQIPRKLGKLPEDWLMCLQEGSATPKCMNSYLVQCQSHFCRTQFVRTVRKDVRNSSRLLIFGS